MGIKRSDRVFQISVAAFSLVLATIAIGTIVAVKDPALLGRHGAHLFNWSSTEIGLANSSSRQESVTVVRKAHKVKVNSAKSAQPVNDTDESENTKQEIVTVEPYGNHVKAVNLREVKQLLSDGNLVNTVSDSLHMTLHKPVSIFLVGNKEDYAAQLSSLGVSSDEIKAMTLDTGGFTEGTTIMIPLYQNRYSYDLANTLAHELTHAFINQNVSNIPSWMNEGLAVSNGMAAQAKVQNPVAFAGYVRQMAESILSATVSGTLIPLTDDEEKILQQSIPYDLELQDWLAVRELVKTKGETALQNYFSNLNSGSSASSAFNQAFGLSENDFNQQLTKLFMTFEEQQDNGAVMGFDFSDNYQGSVQILQHGMQTWRGFVPRKGSNMIHLLPAGGILTNATLTSPDFDSTPPDETTVYVNLEPSHPFSYQGQSVTDSGFAFDYHDGMYGYVNSWITVKNGHTIYTNTPDLFGVSIISAEETRVNRDLMDLIHPQRTS